MLEHTLVTGTKTAHTHSPSQEAMESQLQAACLNFVSFHFYLWDPVPGKWVLLKNFLSEVRMRGHPQIRHSLEVRLDDLIPKVLAFYTLATNISVSLS